MFSFALNFKNWPKNRIKPRSVLSMYATVDISPFVQQSQHAANFYMHARGVFVAIKKSFGNWPSVLIMPFAAGFLWLFLWGFRKNLRKLYSSEVSLQDYKKTRREYDLLNTIFSTRFRITGNDKRSGSIKKSPWILQGSLRLAYDIFQLIQLRRDAIGRALQQLNDAAPRTDLLQPVPESDLWESRTKVYDYRF